MRRGDPFLSHMHPHKFPFYPASVWWSEQLSSPGRQGLWTALMEHKDRKIGGAQHLKLCFYFLSAEPLMIPVAKGAFVTTESSLWCCCLRDQQCRATLTCAFWNPVILGICFVLVLGKGSELPPNQRQIALVGHGWTKAPLAPAQLQILLFYITEGEWQEAPLWFGVFDPVFLDTILSSWYCCL